MIKVQILHGPNLNLLGTREPKLYGSVSLDALNTRLLQLAKTLHFELAIFQSNAEHELIDRIQQAPKEKIELIIMNPAGFTHTSIALRDSLLAVAIPLIEVHLSNVHARESFRKHSFFSDIAVGVITGFGINSYELALYAANDYFIRNYSRET